MIKNDLLEDLPAFKFIKNHLKYLKVSIFEWSFKEYNRLES